MSEDTGTTTTFPAEQPTGTETPETEVKDWKAEAEKWREMSKKNEARARDNAAAAKRLAEIEDATKTAEQRAAEKIAALEQQLAAKDVEALRARIQAKFGIDDEDAALFLTATDEATLAKQAQRLAETRTRQGNRVPNEGRAPRPAVGDADERAAARALFGTGG